MSDEDDAIRVAGGRAAERTALAWNRSALALAATGGLLVKAGADGGTLLSGLAGGGSLVLAAALAWVYGLLAFRRPDPDRSGPFAPSLAYAGLSAVSVAAGAIATVIVVIG